MSADEVRTAAEWKRRLEETPWLRSEQGLIADLESRERRLAAAEARVKVLESKLAEAIAVMRNESCHCKTGFRCHRCMNIQLWSAALNPPKEPSNGE